MTEVRRIENAILMSDGSMQVRPHNPEVEQIYPLDQWIAAHQRFGGKVYRRTVIVVDDWQEVLDGSDRVVGAARRE